MVISNYSMRIVEEDFQKRFNRTLQIRLQKLFAVYYAGNEGLHRIEEGRLECDRRRIFTERGIFLYLCLQALTGNSPVVMSSWNEYVIGFDGSGDEAMGSFFQVVKNLIEV